MNTALPIGTLVLHKYCGETVYELGVIDVDSATAKMRYYAGPDDNESNSTWHNVLLRNLSRYIPLRMRLPEGV